MIPMLKPGQKVITKSSGVECTLVEYLGGGGQGDVYRAEMAGRFVAVKWYLSRSATERQRASIELLVRKGPPTDRFLWPLELVSCPGVRDFGYMMPLRESRFRGIADLMKRRIDPTFRALTTAGFGLAHSFLHLHSQGLCYRDISFGNIFFDPHTGEVAICDNDNVTVDGDPASGILGTPRFMAPEVVRGEALPSTQTDLFSLAVLLFYLFLVHHPLEGRRELEIHSFDLPAMTRLYGTHPLFIFDPHDRSNAPVPGQQDNAILAWPIYPRFLRDLFTRSFTTGLHDSEHGRVREGEWRAGMIRLRDSIVYCSSCGAENFYDGDALRASGGAPPNCWACKANVPLPYRLRFGRSLVMLNHDTRLFVHHVDEQRANDFSRAVAEMARHPQHPDVWGLKNLSDETWSYSSGGDPRPSEVLPGRIVRLENGMRINFGRVEGEVRV
ncbi:MAG: serine/threonine protein kinase [Proteobacteria bacterium]|nr:MAG: serine/threonine protein kinase [Pseudomonadota bacterium]